MKNRHVMWLVSPLDEWRRDPDLRESLLESLPLDDDLPLLLERDEDERELLDREPDGS